jgi:hypothetical protein
MTMEFFVNECANIAKTNCGIKLYPYDDKEKLYNRFLKKMFWLNNRAILEDGFLGELYSKTNGMDLYDFYIVPFNNYFT